MRTDNLEFTGNFGGVTPLNDPAFGPERLMTAPGEQQGSVPEKMMTIEECYQQLGGNYSEVRVRLPSPQLIEKYLGRFLEDRSFDALYSAFKAGDRAEAFRAAHTLKGVCANMGFTRLLESAARLTEALRPDAPSVPDAAVPLMQEVCRDYQMTVSAIRTYFDRGGAQAASGC